MAAIQGKDVHVEISTDGGTTWKTLICELSNGVNMSRETTSTQTKCNDGAAVIGLGALSWSFDFEAVHDTEPSGTQVTYPDMQAAIVAGTLLKGRVAYTGEFYHAGDVYVTDLTLTNPSDDTVRFSGTLSGTGALDITE